MQQMGLWKVQPGAFEGLAERCAPGVPEDAVALLAKHNVRDVPVLDLLARKCAPKPSVPTDWSR